MSSENHNVLNFSYEKNDELAGLSQILSSIKSNYRPRNSKDDEMKGGNPFRIDNTSNIIRKLSGGSIKEIASDIKKHIGGGNNYLHSFFDGEFKKIKAHLIKKGKTIESTTETEINSLINELEKLEENVDIFLTTFRNYLSTVEKKESPEKELSVEDMKELIKKYNEKQNKVEKKQANLASVIQELLKAL